MVLSWLGSSKELSLQELIARKQYKKAIDLLQAEFQKGDRSPRMRMQFADLLYAAGRGREALPILLGLADEFARDGFAAKAIALLKKAEKIQPGDDAVERRLAGLIHKEKHRPLTITPTGSFQVQQFDMEEIDDAATLAPTAGSRPLPLVPPPPKDKPLPTSVVPVVPEPVAPAPTAEPVAAAPAAPPEEEAEIDLGVELVSLIQTSYEDSQPQKAAPTAPTYIPLFGDFSSSELAAVIHGLRLLSYQPGDVIITQGEHGSSLFVLTEGSVKAWVRNPEGKHVQVREMQEGEFFGEISLLSGLPRTATVTAASRCELLELDRGTLDEIKKRHPRVLAVLHQFSEQRLHNPDAERIKQGQ
jgi:hypothetical protein